MRYGGDPACAQFFAVLKVRIPRLRRGWRRGYSPESFLGNADLDAFNHARSIGALQSLEHHRHTASGGASNSDHQRGSRCALGGVASG
jgi:hypothetical protein